MSIQPYGCKDNKILSYLTTAAAAAVTITAAAAAVTTILRRITRSLVLTLVRLYHFPNI